MGLMRLFGNKTWKEQAACLQLRKQLIMFLAEIFFLNLNCVCAVCIHMYVCVYTCMCGWVKWGAFMHEQVEARRQREVSS